MSVTTGCILSLPSEFYFSLQFRRIISFDVLFFSSYSLVQNKQFRVFILFGFSPRMRIAELYQHPSMETGSAIVAVSNIKIKIGKLSSSAINVKINFD